MAAPNDRQVVIVDYGAGNLRSVARAVAHAGYEPLVTANPRLIENAWSLIVPGVGAAEDIMANLNAGGFSEPIRDYIDSGRPFLGICMGMQALFDLSLEDGRHECLGVLPGTVVRFPPGRIVPHMGWNTVYVEPDHPVFEGIPQGSYFYFVHSYYATEIDATTQIGKTEYAGWTFPSVVARNNVIATQFHPEKSGESGLRLYTNFIRLAHERGSIAPGRVANGG